MTLRFDTSRAPVSATDFEELARAVHAAGPGDEAVWIEWKSTLQMGSPEGKAAVVRCIAGLANRMPEAAARFCEGRGYLLVGVEPGGLQGVTAADPAQLTQWWSPYLGADGPRWAVHWVDVAEKTVLVVEVAAPHAGDPVHLIKKTMNDVVRDGEVFVRRPGQTERANSVEMQQLVARATQGRALTGVSLSLDSPAQIRPVHFGPEAVEARLQVVREQLLSSLRGAERPRSQPLAERVVIDVDDDGEEDDKEDWFSSRELRNLEEREAAGETLTSQEQLRLRQGREELRETMERLRITIGAANTSALWGGIKQEDRTAEQYEAEVEKFLEALRDALPDQLQANASQVIRACLR